MKITDFIKELEGVRERWGNILIKGVNQEQLHWLKETTALVTHHSDELRVIVATVKKEENQ